MKIQLSKDNIKSLKTVGYTSMQIKFIKELLWSVCYKELLDIEQHQSFSQHKISHIKMIEKTKGVRC